MTMKLKQLCRQAGCGRRTHGSWCGLHIDQANKARWTAADKHRGSVRERGYTARWDRVSKMFRRANPLCKRCEETGRTTPAEEVDHIIPVKERPDLQFDVTNLQSLCKRHHAIKTRNDRARKRRNNHEGK